MKKFKNKFLLYFFNKYFIIYFKINKNKNFSY